MPWWVSQKLHDAASGMLIQGRDDQEVPGVILCDSTQVEKRFKHAGTTQPGRSARTRVASQMRQNRPAVTVGATWLRRRHCILLPRTCSNGGHQCGKMKERLKRRQLKFFIHRLPTQEWMTEKARQNTKGHKPRLLPINLLGERHKHMTYSIGISTDLWTPQCQNWGSKCLEKQSYCSSGHCQDWGRTDTQEESPFPTQNTRNIPRAHRWHWHTYHQKFHANTLTCVEIHRAVKKPFKLFTRSVK